MKAKKIIILFFSVSMGLMAPLYAQEKTFCQIREKTPLLQASYQEVDFYLTSGEECIVKIPFLYGGRYFDLSNSGGFAFEIAGEKDIQEFMVGLEFDGQTRFINNIIEYLPLSVVDKWQQAGIHRQEIQSKGIKLDKITHFVIKFHKRGSGKLFLRNFKHLPLIEGREKWEMMLFSKEEFQVGDISEIGVFSMGFYGDAGWKMGNIYEKEKTSVPQIRELAFSKPPMQGDYYVVADFNQGNQNYLGGYFNDYYQAPGKSYLTVNSDEKRGEGKSLHIDYEQELSGFSGGWVHLFDFKKPPAERVFFDSSDFTHLSFWIKSHETNQDVFVQLADSRWEKKEDSVIVGKITDFLKTGITKEWQHVMMPLNQKQLEAVDRKRLAGIILNFRFPGKGTLYIDDIAFLKNEKAIVPETRNLTPIRKKEITNAMWIWDTPKQLENENEQIELLEFCKRSNIHIIFWQMQYDVFKENDTYRIKFKKEEELKKFIRRATSYGIAIEALDGFSRFALRPWHPIIFAQIEEIIAYNKRVAWEERFSGIHHDNEPYLIPAYWGRIQEEVMIQYLELCEKVQHMVHDAGIGLVYGVDIPFWYEERNFDFKVPVEVTWKGVRKPASFHIIDIDDNVGIMDYRTKAYGADGNITHGIDEMQYAEKVGKEIFIWLETFYLPDETFAVFRAWHKLKLAPKNLNGATAEIYPVDAPPEAQFIERKVQAHKYYLVLDQFETLGIVYIRRLQKDEKFRDMLEDVEKMSLKRTVSPSEIAVDVLGSKLSFSGMDREYFLDTVDKNHEFFSQYKSFKGFAFHFYETLKGLLEKKQ